MKRLLLCTTALAGLVASSALAADLNNGTNVTFSATSKFEAGVRKLNGGQSKNYPLTANQNSSAFRSTAKVAVNVTNKVDDMTYGASIRVQVATNQSNGTDRDERLNRSHIFVDSGFGSVQLGTNVAASKLMGLNAGTIASGTGGVDGDYTAFLSNPWLESRYDSKSLTTGSASNVVISGINGAQPVASTGNTLGVSAGSALNGQQQMGLLVFSDVAVTGIDTLSDRKDGATESANKITYVSPRVEGVQFGMSFTPDMSNGGNSNNSNSFYGSNQSYVTYGNTLRFKNIWSLALNYRNSFKDVNVELSATTNLGKSVQKRSTAASAATTTNTVTNSVNSNNLKTYTLGAMLEKDGFSAVVSYANDGKSGLPSTLMINQLTATTAVGAGADTTTVNGIVPATAAAPAGQTLTPTAVSTHNYKSSWYTAGVAYENGPMSTSFTYLNGKKGVPSYSMKTQSMSIGGAYEVASGFKPFAEVTYVTYTPQGSAIAALNAQKVKATVFILGTRVKF